MYIFESVIHAKSFAFLNKLVCRLRNFSRRRRSFFTLAIFKRSCDILQGLISLWYLNLIDLVLDLQHNSI